MQLSEAFDDNALSSFQSNAHAGVMQVYLNGLTTYVDYLEGRIAQGVPPEEYLKLQGEYRVLIAQLDLFKPN